MSWRESPWSKQSLTGQPDWYPAVFLHVWIFHYCADRKVGATKANGQHFITGLLASSRPGTFLWGGTFLPDLCWSLWAWGWPLWSQQDVQRWCSAGYGLTGLSRLRNFLFMSIIFTYNSQMHNNYNLNFSLKTYFGLSGRHQCALLLDELSGWWNSFPRWQSYRFYTSSLLQSLQGSGGNSSPQYQTPRELKSSLSLLSSPPALPWQHNL